MPALLYLSKCAFIFKSKTNHILNIFSLLSGARLDHLYLRAVWLFHFLEDNRISEFIADIIVNVTPLGMLVLFEIILPLHRLLARVIDGCLKWSV